MSQPISLRCNHGECQQIQLRGIDRQKQLMLRSDTLDDDAYRRCKPETFRLDFRVQRHELWSRLATVHTSISP